MASFKYLPLFVFGKVVRGYGRGSKELGIPTANLSETTVDLLPELLRPGIYFGLASVDCGPVHKMVLSVGWNPFYHNKKKSMETHILHTFAEDFYGSLLKLVILDFIRSEQNFSSQDELIKAIKGDITIAQSKLEDSSYQQYYSHSFWTKTCDNQGGVYTKETSLSALDCSSRSPQKGTDAIVNGET